ncbi:MAG TPA: hypothetical protein VMF03_15885 [Steroidobacteraceae bacterium]|nr:hypothetical protein [Steroidobacteraceae bacterium]
MARRLIWRILVMLHRYLGVAVGALMLLWFASGIVMLFVPYPALGESERVGMLEPIPWQLCCGDLGSALSADQPLERAEVETVSGIPALRFALPGQQGMLVSLDATTPVVPLDAPHARATAVAAAMRLGVMPAQPLATTTIVRDQWTVSGEYRADRPLYRFDFGDPAGTQIYVSSQRGRVVLRTTAAQRFWNWLGAVPHWLYPTILRSHPKTWTQVVIWTSLLGVFLTAMGLYLGIAQYRFRGGNLLSPYRGVWNWHHSLGLLFGVFSLTWIVSGLISMNPWGFLEGGDGVEPTPEVHSVTWGEVRSSLAAIAKAPPSSDIVTLSMVPLAGNLCWMATDHRGTAMRLAADGHRQPMTDADLQIAARHAAGPSGIASRVLLRDEDAYYYRHHAPLLLPVLRVIVNDPDHTWLYLDPRSGRVLGQFDADGRWQRWLFDGLHRLDFLAQLRASRIWTALVVFLLVGGIGLTGTGTYMAVRRLILDLSKASG